MSERDEYERDLRKRQQEHLRKVHLRDEWRACMHDACPSCVGTGIRVDGSPCFHGIACSCPKCNRVTMRGVQPYSSGSVTG